MAFKIQFSTFPLPTAETTNTDPNTDKSPIISQTNKTRAIILLSNKTKIALLKRLIESKYYPEPTENKVYLSVIKGFENHIDRDDLEYYCKNRVGQLLPLITSEKFNPNMPHKVFGPSTNVQNVTASQIKLEHLVEELLRLNKLGHHLSSSLELSKVEGVTKEVVNNGIIPLNELEKPKIDPAPKRPPSPITVEDKPDIVPAQVSKPIPIRKEPIEEIAEEALEDDSPEQYNPRSVSQAEKLKDEVDKPYKNIVLEFRTALGLAPKITENKVSAGTMHTIQVFLRDMGIQCSFSGYGSSKATASEMCYKHILQFIIEKYTYQEVMSKVGRPLAATYYAIEHQQMHDKTWRIRYLKNNKLEKEETSETEPANPFDNPSLTDILGVLTMRDWTIPTKLYKIDRFGIALSIDGLFQLSRDEIMYVWDLTHSSGRNYTSTELVIIKALITTMLETLHEGGEHLITNDCVVSSNKNATLVPYSTTWPDGACLCYGYQTIQSRILSSPASDLSNVKMTKVQCPDHGTRILRVGM